MVFDQMQRFVAPDVYSYTILIDALCKRRNVEEAMALFSDMERSGISASIVTYNALIDGLCKRNMLKEAFALKEKMVRISINPSIVTFGILINGLVKLDRFGDVELVLTEMEEIGIPPNVVIYNTLIYGHCKMGRPTEALKLRDKMVAKGIEPNCVTYNIIVQGLCDAGDMKQAEYILDEILSNGMEVNAGLFGSIIFWLVTKEQRLDCAVRLLGEMLLRNLRPNDSLLTTLIVELCRMEEAIGLLNQLKDEDLVPDLFTCSMIIDGYCKVKEIDKAKSFLKEMRTWGLEANVVVYNSLVSGFCKNGNITGASNLVDEMKSNGILPNFVTYSSLMHGFCCTGYLEEAKRIFELMKENGMGLNVVTYTTLIAGYCRSGQMDEAIKVYKAMCVAGVTPNKFTYTVLIQGYAKMGNLEAASKLLDEMVNNGIVPDAVTYNVLMSEFCKEVCLVTTPIATDGWYCNYQFDCSPSTFTIFSFGVTRSRVIQGVISCVAIGLWADLVIGFVTEYYTRNAYGTIQDGADSCRAGAATNVIFGLALGYKSVIVPNFATAVSIFVRFSLGAMYGIAVAALGMLSSIATGPVIDAYGLTSDNIAGGIAQMDGTSHRIQERTDALDTAGNTTAALGRGGNLCLGDSDKNNLDSSFGKTATHKFQALQLIQLPWSLLQSSSYFHCGCSDTKGLQWVDCWCDASLLVLSHDHEECRQCSSEEGGGGALVMLTPLIIGILFVMETLSGVLAGSLVSGVQIVIRSSSNIGGAWDNAKKYIEAGALDHARSLGPKESVPHKAAVICGTIGDPLKDMSGSSPVKLMAVEFLVLAPFFATNEEVSSFSLLKLRIGGSLQDKVIFNTGNPQQPCLVSLKDAYPCPDGAHIIFGSNALDGKVPPSDDDGSLGPSNYTNAW
ncbi:PPR repeat [Musa troglodytarum]|uniref:H(+)-exporting diphosphatase n=1 Tax=Musa troglodytarum TaxID=320322 RepID=A0A9E7EVM3_9LILI|nr:PPR repeat [Musa troglodytarum]